MNDDTNERRDLCEFLNEQAGAQRHCLRDNVGEIFGEQ